MKPFDELIAALREEADRYAETDAHVSGAKLCRRIAGEIESAEREWLWGTLTIQEAADETGRSYTTIWRKVKRGKLENVGTDEHPKVRRLDLYTEGRPVGSTLVDKVLEN